MDHAGLQTITIESMRAALELSLLALCLSGCGPPADAPRALPRATLDVPPAEVIAADATPFEGCRLGVWTAREATPVYSVLGDTAVASTLAAGAAVTAVAGEVRATPRRATVTRVYSTDTAAGIDVGEIVYALYPIGEGALAVWHDGKVTNGSLDLTLAYDGPAAAPPLQWVWWVRVRLADGTHGWLRNPQGRFDGMDALG